jgi:hypothetical protein
MNETMICPDCGENCSRESVDIGVGTVYGTWGCYCGWSEDQIEGCDQWGMRTPAGRTMLDDLIDGSDHPYTCRCAVCLRWWVSVGPEEIADGWGFGPFTESEFVAAGGVIPEQIS